MAALKRLKLLSLSFLLSSIAYSAEAPITARFTLTGVKDGNLRLVETQPHPAQTTDTSHSIPTNAKTETSCIKKNPVLSTQTTSPSFVVWSYPKTLAQQLAFDEKIARCNKAVQEISDLFKEKPKGNEKDKLKKFCCRALKKMNEVSRVYEDFLSTLPGEVIFEKKQIAYGQALKDPSAVRDTTEVSYRFQEIVHSKTSVASLVNDTLVDIQDFFNLLKASTHLQIVVNYLLLPYINKDALHQELLRKGQDLPNSNDAEYSKKYHEILLKSKKERDTSLKELTHQVMAWFVPDYLSFFSAFQNNWVTLSCWDPNIYDKMIDNAYQQINRIQNLSEQLSAIEDLYELKEEFMSFLNSYKKVTSQTNEVPDGIKVFRKKLISVLANFVWVFDSSDDWKSTLRSDLQYIEKELVKLKIEDLKKLYSFHNDFQAPASQRNTLIQDIKKLYEKLSQENFLHAKILFFIDSNFILKREQLQKAFLILYDMSCKILLNKLTKLGDSASNTESSSMSFEEIDKRFQDCRKQLSDQKEQIISLLSPAHRNLDYERSLRLLYFKYQKEILVFKSFIKILPEVYMATKDEWERRENKYKEQQQKDPHGVEEADRRKQDSSSSTSSSGTQPATPLKDKRITQAEDITSSSSSISIEDKRGASELSSSIGKTTKEKIKQDVAEVTIAKSVHEALRAENETIKREIANLRAELMHQQKSSASTAAQMLQLSEENERLEKEKQEATHKKEELDSTIRAKEAELNSLRTEIAKLRNQIQLAEKRSSQAESSNMTSLAKISTLNTTVKNLKQKIEELEPITQRLSQDNDSLKSQLLFVTEKFAKARNKIKLLAEKSELADKQRTELSLLQMFNAQLQQESHKLKIENAGLTMAIEGGDLLFEKMIQFFGPGAANQFLGFLTRQQK